MSVISDHQRLISALYARGKYEGIHGAIAYPPGRRLIYKMRFVVPTAIAIVWAAGVLAAVNPVDFKSRYHASEARRKDAGALRFSQTVLDGSLFVALVLAAIAGLPTWSFNQAGNYRFSAAMAILAALTGVVLLCRAHEV